MARRITTTLGYTKATWGVPLVRVVLNPARPGNPGNPGRREVRAAEESRSRWVHHHDHALRQLMRFALTKLPEDADPKRREALKAGCNFKPHKLPKPRMRHKRGAMRRAFNQFLKAQQAAQ